MRNSSDLVESWTFYDRLVEEIFNDRFIYIAIFAYCFLTIGLLVLTGQTQLFSYAQYFQKWPVLFAVVMPAVLFAVEFWRLALRRVLGDKSEIQLDLSSARMARLIAGIILMQAVGLFLGSFTSIKNAMPVWRDGFHHDLVQADIDKWLHFGSDLPPLLADCCSNSWLIWFVELNYSQYWFLLVFGALFVVLVSRQADPIRFRFVSVFLLTWVICGNLAAFLFLSAGPIFFGEVTGDFQRFGELAFSQLGEGASTTELYRAYLWQAYSLGRAGIGTGISAFPSVHVAASVVLALFAFERNRWLGLSASFYAMIILFSSVLLGWHYAIDGYVAIVVVVAIYLAARKTAAIGLPALFGWMPFRHATKNRRSGGNFQ